MMDHMEFIMFTVNQLDQMSFNYSTVHTLFMLCDWNESLDHQIKVNFGIMILPSGPIWCLVLCIGDRS